MRWYVLKSFWYPIRDIGDVIRIFWPAILSFLLAQGAVVLHNYLMLILPETGINQIYFQSLVVLLLAIYVYGGLQLFMGIVSWHKKMVKGYEKFTHSLLPGIRELKYIGFVVGFFILNVILFSFIIVVPYIAIQPLDLSTTPDLAYARAFVNHHLPVFTGVVLSFFLSFFLLLFFRRSVVMLPGVATEDPGGSINMELLSEKVRGYKWSISIILVLFVPILLMFAVKLGQLVYTTGSSETLKDPMLKLLVVQGFQTVIAFLVLYSSVAFATLLSLVYRDQVMSELQAGS